MAAISIASFVALILGAACILAIRKLTSPRAPAEDLCGWTDFDWQGPGPLERLLEPTDFELLQERGMSPKLIRRLRAQRRGLFRMYLRRLTKEFNTAHDSLQMLLVGGSVDRPDLAQELHHQRLLFYRGLVGVEVRLALHAAGFDTVPPLGLLGPLERMHLEFCRLAPSAAA